jgi:hypothetical protein
MERRDLYEDDLTDERQPTPAERDDVARTEVLDPDFDFDDDGSVGHLDDIDGKDDGIDVDDV